jgi:hypothetical protein
MATRVLQRAVGRAKELTLVDGSSERMSGDLLGVAGHRTMSQNARRD